MAGRNDPAIAVDGEVVEHLGRFVVYLRLGRWDPGRHDESSYWERLEIGTYATRAAAETARTWIVRGARRQP